ncbi:GNAT family N-acetyltransferase [Motilimonas eburnea]|uniref:GNAT family N-acetyltransferase n=1 Tax=Motilimonas eburnea TaxID=1737488 RepID=UPI001E558FDD|nr:GNAT family N-acetyltransferase [Motilimonas eburnea]MCE2572362.1 GNAT family N-acetyltransferase [Motilimonas eburnea]
MHIQQVAATDLESVTRLVAAVAKTDILPHFNQQGQQEFNERALPDLRNVFEGDNFLAVKAVADGKLLGFAALRDGNYLTHLFVANEARGTGLGRELLQHLLATTASEIRLRSSVNAVGFYQHNGFVATGEEAEFNGIRFVPMLLSPVGSPNACPTTIE